MIQKKWHQIIVNLSLKSLALMILISLCFGLQSSTTHYSPVLQYYFLQEELAASYSGLWPPAKDGSDVALDALARLAAVNNDIYWLEKAASLNSLYAQLSLGKLTTGQEQINWWRKAANNGHGPSQFELSLTVISTEQRIRYLEQAALNEHIPAIIALSKYYYEEDDASNALRWLGKASQYDHSNIFRMAKMLWQQGKYEEATEAFERASIQDYEAKEYLWAIKNASRQHISALRNSSNSLRQQCSQDLQFVATSLDSAVQANTFKKQFEKDTRLASLAICIKPIIWLTNNDLDCVLKDHRQVCNLSSLVEPIFTPNFTHLVFFLKQGKAYVQNGIMYLDKADAYSVFVHELAHFVGFVDEYAVSSSLAEQYCNVNIAPNLIVSEDANLKDHATFQIWQRYNQQLRAKKNRGISSKSALRVGKSPTCVALGKKSYKPSRRLTFLQYHDTNLIPPIYLKMWQDLLKQHHQSIAVSEAFRLQAQNNANNEVEEHWASF